MGGLPTLEKRTHLVVVSKKKLLALGIGFMVWKYDEHRGLSVFSSIASIFGALMHPCPSGCFTNHIGDNGPSNTLE